MLKQKLRQAYELLGHLHSAAKHVMRAGVLFSICLLVICICLGTFNLSYDTSAYLTHTGMQLAESAVSMFTLSVGCGLVFDYAIKKNQIQ